MLLIKELVMRKYKNGGMEGDSLKDRLLRLVNKGSDGCWMWQGNVGPSHGYGTIKFENKMYMAHRASYEQHCGDIPEGLLVCHKCDVRTCINPDHLFLGTHSDNNWDCADKGRKPRGESHHMTKLTESDVKKIRAIYKSGKHSQRQIGKMFGMHQANISLIVLRKRWNHV
jgi:hypothetical protein